MTTRRDLLAGAASLVIAGRANAQQRTYRIGFLSPGPGGQDPGGPMSKALFDRLEELGYREGHNLLIERRFAAGELDRLPALAAELVAVKPDLLFVIGTQATLAASKATRTIPVVFINANDPVGLAIVKSLRQPGTNATGMSAQGDEFLIKLLQLLKEVFPSASRVAVLHDPANTTEVRLLPTLKQAAATLGLSSTVIETRSPEGLGLAFTTVKAQRPDVLLVMPGPLAFSQRGRIVELANGQRQPAVYGQVESAEAGGLMSYSFNRLEQARTGATFIDKVLRGASPAVLPVEQPTRFELVLNLRTAKAQGVTFPATVLLRADRVIE